MGRGVSQATRLAHAAVEYDMDQANGEGIVGPCKGRPAGFFDYQSEEEPEVYAAQEECVNDCRLLAICKRKAKLEQPVHGVWAGDVWGDDREGKGRVIRRAPKVAISA